MRKIVIILLLALSACVTSSNVVPMGKDSFMVSVNTRGGAGSGAAKAAEIANQYCAKLNLLMVVRRMDRSGVMLGTAPVTNDLVFSCVAESDPEYTRPNLKKDPAVVVER